MASRAIFPSAARPSAKRLILLDGLRVNDAQTAPPQPGRANPARRLGAGGGFEGFPVQHFMEPTPWAGAVNFIPAVPKATEVRLGSQVGNFGVNSQNLDASFLRGCFQ